MYCLGYLIVVFFCKQKTAYDMRIIDWSSDVCSSDLIVDGDKRILLIDGKPVDYCLALIPQGDEFRGNLAAGGRGEGRPLSERDRWIAAQVEIGRASCRERVCQYV